ncbi:hypothetical protein ACFVZR_26850 [Streptomyces sp. NPDC058316]|uniref:hypothetical protein n=1 Tax=unclassified Streptomyces TaxID=2593676 RepID=UPI0036E1B4C6
MRAGCPGPDTGTVQRLLGTDRGIVCESPDDALRTALWRIQLSNGSGGPGQRPVIADTKAVCLRKADGALGQGGSIPLCNVLSGAFPRAEIILMGVEEPQCLIDAFDESVDPTEIQHMAHVEALFLRRYAAAPRGRGVGEPRDREVEGLRGRGAQDYR